MRDRGKDRAIHFPVESYLEDAVGIQSHSDGGRGTEIIIGCPFCSAQYKCYVNAETGLWICYRCTERGSLRSLIAEVEGISLPKADRMIRRRLNKSIAKGIQALRGLLPPSPLEEGENPDRRPKQLYAPSSSPSMRGIDLDTGLPEDFIPIVEPGVVRRHPYLLKRGITLKSARRFGIGYCERGRYKSRVVFPIVEYGKVVSFAARATWDCEGNKYMHPPADGKKDLLYGLDEICAARAIVVEGPTDVIGMRQKHHRAVALFGKVASPVQARKLRSKGVTSVILMLDPGAGKTFVAKAAAVFSLVMDEVLIATLPAGEDPDTATRQMVEAAIAAAVPPSLSDSLAGRLAGLGGRRRRLRRPR